MMIESAQDSLRGVRTPAQLEDQAKELYCAVGDKSPDFVAGYQLGVETARVMITVSAEVNVKGCNPKNIL